ncbi:MAG: nucleoside deaminase [Terriglobales bacterium]
MIRSDRHDREHLTADQRFIGEALAEARKVRHDLPIGCVVVLNGEIIGRGRNMREETNDPAAHAEIVALRDAAKQVGNWRLSGCTLYTTLEPCPMCAEALLQARVSRLVFGAYDLKSGAAGSAFNLFTTGRIYPIPEIIGGICESECEQLLVQFFKIHVRGGAGEEQI